MSDYSPTTWMDGAAPGISAANLNKIEAGIDTAHSELDDHKGLVQGQTDHSIEHLAVFGREGTLTVRSGKGRFRFPIAVTLLGVSAAVNVAPSGAGIIIDVNKNGTTIYTTQANRPTIAAGATSSNETAPNVTGAVAGDYLSVDIDQVGSAAAGAHLTVFVRYRRA